MTASGGKANINVTPMIDVLLVLLIIFMVVVNPDSVGLDASVPEEPEEQISSAKSQDIVLMVRNDGTVTVNQEVIPEAGLQARLAQIYRTRGNSPVFVGADRRLEYQPVVDAIDTARGVGFKQIALLPRDR